jgi:hypothetical protein
VLNAINMGFPRKIAVTYVEWAGTKTESTVVGWRLVED